MKMRDIYIASAGMYLPRRLTVDEAISLGQADESLREEVSVTSARVAGTTPAPDMAVRAAREAVGRAGLPADAIDAFFYATAWHQGPDGWSPQHYVLRNALGRDVPAFEVRQGCNGFLASMDLGACYLAASEQRNAVLIAAADNFETPLVDRWRSSPASVLGDAATAMVLSRRTGFAELLALNLTSVAELEEADRFGEEIFPPPCTLGLKADHRARSRRYLDSFTTRMPPYFTLMPAAMTKTIEQTVDDAGVAISDIKRVCHVNVNDGYLMRFVLGPLGLDASVGTMEIGRQNGHMTSNDTIVSFIHLMETRQVGPGDHVMLFTTAPGQSIACALIRVNADPDWSIPTAGR